MKTKLFTLCFAALLISSVSYGKIRRIGYFGTAVSGTDYTTMQLAHDASAVGDTILLFPGSWTCNVSKRLVVLGYGYIITGANSNPNLQNITGSLTMRADMYVGSDSTVFEGIDAAVIGAYYNNSVSKVIVRRCAGQIYFNNATSDNWRITQSFINSAFGFNWNGGNVTNLYVANCFLYGVSMNGGLSSGMNGQFVNNVFAPSTNSNFGNGSFIFQNNVFGYPPTASSITNSVFQNNISTGSIPAGNGNQTISQATMNNVFVGNPTLGSASYDGAFMLKAGSVAIGAGIGGTDAGMYGGSNPYKLSGIPSIPTFYKLTAPDVITAGNPYNITFSVRSNN